MRNSKLKTIVSLAIISTLMLNTFASVSGASNSVHYWDVDSSNAKAADRISDLRSKYLNGKTKLAGDPLRGIGWSDGGDIILSSANSERLRDIQLKENVLAMAALSKVADASDDAEAETWAQSQIWKKGVTPLKTTNVQGSSYSSDLDIYAASASQKYAIDQFFFLEFTAESFESSDNSDMFAEIQSVYQYTAMLEAEVNDTLGNNARYGAYWTAVKDGGKLNDGTAGRYNVNPENNEYPLTNMSLWAAAGIGHVSSVLKSTGTEDDLAKETRISAEKAMAYAMMYGYNTSFGLFHESQEMAYWTPYQANTQIVALLASTRLYEATGKESYLIQADSILNSIMTYFWNPGMGGVVKTLDSSTKSANIVMTGYDNALFAYALTQLGLATGAEEMSYLNFVLLRTPENKYMDLAMDVIAFMGNSMWQESTDGSIVGYIEYISADGTQSYDYSTFTNPRMILTNMLALYVLAEITVQEKAWWEYYSEYVLYTGIALGVILMIVVVVARKRNAGTKLPSVVKGLLGDED